MNDKIKNFFEKIYFAGSESDLSNVLSSTDILYEWEPLGSNDNNFGIIENQQSSPIAALIEKITNSIDAILLRKCNEYFIDPKSSKAPRSMEDAIKFFFKNEYSCWHLNSSRQKQAEEIQILADGPKFNTSLIVYDNGEGQHPDNFVNTFLSLLKGNKNEIRFVQGKYNMGGTGAIVFCGKQRYQLICSRRYDKTGDFGFTLIRKHPLTEDESNDVT